MSFTQVKHPAWADAAHTAINCMVTFDGLGEIAFTADPKDLWGGGRQIFYVCLAGTFGPVADYAPPPSGAVDSALQAKEGFTAMVRRRAQSLTAAGNGLAALLLLKTIKE